MYSVKEVLKELIKDGKAADNEILTEVAQEYPAEFVDMLDWETFIDALPDELKVSDLQRREATNAPEEEAPKAPKKEEPKKPARGKKTAAAGTGKARFNFDEITDKNVDEVIGETPLTAEEMKKLSSRKLYNIATRVFDGAAKDLKNRDATEAFLRAKWDGNEEPEEIEVPKKEKASGYNGVTNAMKLAKMCKDRGFDVVRGKKAAFYVDLLEKDDAEEELKKSARGKAKKAAPKKEEPKEELDLPEEIEGLTERELYKLGVKEYGLKLKQKQSLEYYQKALIKAIEEAAEDDTEGWEDEDDDSDGWNDL